VGTVAVQHYFRHKILNIFISNFTQGGKREADLKKAECGTGAVFGRREICIKDLIS
jgi:hypothetical protein